MESLFGQDDILPQVVIGSIGAMGSVSMDIEFRRRLLVHELHLDERSLVSVE